MSNEVCKICDGHGDYYIKIEIFDEPLLIECDNCKEFKNDTNN
jgi:hypothetical protein